MADDRYVLATGAEGARRLEIVNAVHGEQTEEFLHAAGIAPGMRVVDVGCGVGTITAWLAAEVGPTGEVWAVDVSADQVAQARARVERLGLDNVRFTVASAYETELPRGVFDLAFCRFVLMHLHRPADALAEMAALLKPGGILACEDGDFTRPFCEPPSPAFDRCFELYRALGVTRGADFRLGPKLYGMFLDAGFPAPEVRLVQPVIVRGEAKRLPEWTLEEAIPALLEAGLAPREEIERVLAGMRVLADDERVLFGMAQMTQVWGRKPTHL
jgi:ubiquinone/menaquinone biosynthesis C-methylase UbiE